MLTQHTASYQDVKYYRTGYHAFASKQSRDLGMDLPVEHRRAFLRGWDDASRRGYVLANVVEEPGVLEITRSLSRAKLIN